MRRLALAVLGAAPLVLLAASLFSGPVAWLLAAMAAASLPPAAMLLGLGRRRASGARAAILTLWGLLVATLVGVVLLAVWPPSARGPLGLPWASALAVVGLALVPLILVSWSYAATFRER